MDFVIVCSQRTGSTLFTQLLDQREDVLCNGAIFEARPGRMPVRWAKDPDLIRELVRLREDDPDRFLTRVLAEKDGCLSVGFKVCSGHNDPILDKLLINPEIGKIVLLRQNVLAVYSSALIARRSGERRQMGSDASPEDRAPVEFNERRFLRFWERYAGYYRTVFDRLNAARQVFHLIYYTELNDPRYLGRVLNFIGAEPSGNSGAARNKKQNSADILSRFSNPQDAESFLKKHKLTGWSFETETFLDPGLVA